VGQRVSAPKTAELIASYIRGQIVRGELATGDTLPSEGALMEMFSVSRPTLRVDHLVGLVEGDEQFREAEAWLLAVQRFHDLILERARNRTPGHPGAGPPAGREERRRGRAALAHAYAGRGAHAAPGRHRRPGRRRPVRLIPAESAPNVVSATLVPSAAAPHGHRCSLGQLGKQGTI
jgi:hypothetical protein